MPYLQKPYQMPVFKTFHTAIYIRNKFTRRALTVGKTPHQMLNIFALVLTPLPVFGSECWYEAFGSRVETLESRSLSVMLIA